MANEWVYLKEDFRGDYEDFAEQAVEDLYTEYDDGFIDDIAREVADNLAPIYYEDLWDAAKNIEEDINEVLANFTISNINDLLRLGCIEHSIKAIYEFREIILYNVIARRVNERMAELSQLAIREMRDVIARDNDGLTLEQFLTEEVEEAAELFGNAEQFETLIDKANEIVDDILDKAEGN